MEIYKRYDECFKEIEKIGQGAFGSVFKVLAIS